MKIGAVAYASWKTIQKSLSVLKTEPVTDIKRAEVLRAKVLQALQNSDHQVFKLANGDYNRYCYCMDEWLAFHLEEAE